MKPTNEQLQSVIDCCIELMEYEPSVKDPESRRAEACHGMRLVEFIDMFNESVRQYIMRTQ